MPEDNGDGIDKITACAEVGTHEFCVLPFVYNMNIT